MCGNRAEFIESFLGCAWLGAVAVPINTASRGPQLAHFLHNSGARLLIIEAIFAILIATSSAVSPTLMAELFPTRVRTTSLALFYNFSVAIFGGFAQFIVAWLLFTTGDVLAPAYYVIGAAVIGTACPFCQTMFRDALGAVTHSPPKLLDIAQIAAAGLPADQPTRVE